MKGAGREENEGHVRSTMEVQEQHISVYIQSINVVNSSSNTKSKMSKKKKIVKSCPPLSAIHVHFWTPTKTALRPAGEPRTERTH